MTLELLQNYLDGKIWLVHAVLLLLITLLVDWLRRALLGRLRNGAAGSRFVWDKALLEAARGPLGLLIWVMGLSAVAKVALGGLENDFSDPVAALRKIALIVILAWFATRAVAQFQTHVMTRRIAAGKQFDRTTAAAIARLLRIVILTLMVLSILPILGFSISGVLAFGGVGGVIAGLAARDMLANFFGGLMIYLDRPFEVGDWIRSPDRDIEGTVEEIGWRLTRIRTFDKRPLYLPNAIFNTIAVENPSRMTNRRIYETIGIRYDDANCMSAITADVKQMLRDHPEIDAGQTMIVNFNAFAPSSLDFFVYTFTKTTDWIRFHEIKEDVMLKIMQVIEQHGAECAFPTSTIHLARDAQGSPAQSGD